ncbi:MAG: ParB/RepB/Spo0J family partition protein [Patescibacteria group bacterium]|nr:ParB/RepB/Spo0J family partition protein [Patescibacteria group bacterium]
MKLYEPIKVKLIQLREADWNVNEMSDPKFNQLVRSIQEDGFREPIHVVPIDEGVDENDNKFPIYRIIGGHHRFRAAQQLGFEEITAIVLDPHEYTEDVQKLQSVKMNMIRGKLSSKKFTKLYLELTEKYPDDLMAEFMAFDSEEAMQKMIKDIAKSLPGEMQDKLRKSADEIKTVDDLAMVINRIFAEHGNTVDKSFIFFNYGGKTHALIEMDKDLKTEIDLVCNHCEKHNKNINEVMKEVFAESPVLDSIAKES